MALCDLLRDYALSAGDHYRRARTSAPGVLTPAVAVTAFALGTLTVTALSWRSLRAPSSHGFYRFFVFEGVLVLLILNVPHWFRDPLGPLQLLSWLLLVGSGGLVLGAVLQFRSVRGRTDQPVPDTEFRFEQTTRVLTAGAYRWIRHPMYASLLYLGWGAVLKHVTVAAVAVGLLTSVAVALTARAEEREDLGRFGEVYRDYMQRTKRFVPGLW